MLRKKCLPCKFDTSFPVILLRRIIYKTEGDFAVLQELYKDTLGYNKYCNIGENDPYLKEISNCLCSIIVYSDANCTKLLPLL